MDDGLPHFLALALALGRSFFPSRADLSFALFSFEVLNLIWHDLC